MTTNKAPKDFELEVRELIDGRRDSGEDKEKLALALETQAALLRRDDTWGFNSPEAQEARKRLGIQEPRPTEAEMKNALTAHEALQGGQNLGLEPDTKAPQTQADMEPIPVEDRPDPEQNPGTGALATDTSGKSNKQKKAEQDAATQG